MSEKKTIALNIISSLVLQVVTLIGGFVINKIILSYFGSNTNGLIASVNQFLNYITLLEGGLSGVVMSSLYKPLREGDRQKVSGIVKAAERFFRQIAIIYVVYVCLVAFLYPLFVETKVDYWYVFALTFVLALNLFIQYFFSLTYKLLLTADKKVWFVSFVQTAAVLLNIAAVVLCAKYFGDILIVKLVSAAVFIIQPIAYGIFVRKKYKPDKKAERDEQALSQRWSGFGQNLAYFIHTNTDIVILTIFAGLPLVSVYSVYLMIANALKTVVMSVSSAITPSMGNILAGDDNRKSNAAFNNYEFGIFYITSVLFVCGMSLVTPFVGVYTAGITDINYVRPVFGVLIMLAEMIYCYRDPYVSAAYSAGKFKQTAIYAYIEAAVNIVLSIILVQKYDIIGVAIGTAAAMLVRMICQVFYLKKNILMRPVGLFFKNFAVFGVTSAILTAAAMYFTAGKVTGYLSWAICGIIVFVVSLVVITCVGFLFCRKEFNAIIGRKLKVTGKKETEID